MNILEDIHAVLEPLGIAVETGIFKGTAPTKYIVVVPLADTFALHADNAPGADVQEARLSLYSQSNYIKDKNAIVRAFLATDFTVTGRQYIGYETETGYHHYVVDVAKYYEMEE